MNFRFFKRCWMWLLASAVVLSHHVAGARSPHISIQRVKIALISGAKSQQMEGQLYRVNMATSERRWVAGVALDGRLSRATRCDPEERFEVEIKHPLAVPDDPSRVPCKKDLAFSFTRPEIAISPYAKNTFLAASKGKVDIVGLSKLAVLTRGTSNSSTARAAEDAVVGSTAIWLGDVKLDKYVKRDASSDYRLIFSEEGSEALKARQRFLKLVPTGRIDLPTQEAVTKSIFISTQLPTDTTYCLVAESGSVECSDKKPKQSSPSMKEVQIFHKY